MTHFLYLHCLQLLLFVLFAAGATSIDDSSMSSGRVGETIDPSPQFESKQRWWHLNSKAKKSSGNDASEHEGLIAPASRGDEKSYLTQNVSKTKETDQTNGDDRAEPAPRKRTKHVARRQCSHYNSAGKKWPRWVDRRDATTKTAYRMAVLATLAYWEFHKRPQNPVGFRLRPRQKRGVRVQLCRFRRRVGSVRRHVSRNLVEAYLHVSRRGKSSNGSNQSNMTLAAPSCQQNVLKEVKEDRDLYTFDYWLYDWFEPTSVPGVNYHDTDLLVSTSRDNKVLALTFAGTQSAADHVTNVQTFEPAAHSGLFDGGKNITIEGSLHRGFLNAYSRVERGSVLRLCQNGSTTGDSDPMSSLHQRYGSCTPENKKQKKKKRARNNGGNASATEQATLSNTSTNVVGLNNTDKTSGADSNQGLEKGNDKVQAGKRGGCRTRGEKLMTIMREMVAKALRSGRTVHLSGHSLGGGLATLLALDIVINFPDVPVSKLHLWTFGAPQVADDVFLQSAIAAAPRLRQFVEKHGNGRFHRFVTLSDDCKVDFVSVVTGIALPTHSRNLRGSAARRLGGVRGNVVHFASPHYLLTPDQYSANGTDTKGTPPPKTTTRSTLAAHSIINYLQGISRESSEHPLLTDLPLEWREWVGEACGA